MLKVRGVQGSPLALLYSEKSSNYQLYISMYHFEIISVKVGIVVVVTLHRIHLELEVMEWHFVFQQALSTTAK